MEEKEGITIKKSCFNKIDELFKKYQDNDYIVEKMYNYIQVILPEILAKEDEEKQKKKIKRQMNSSSLNLKTPPPYFLIQQECFIQIFLSNNKYFYYKNVFYKYENKNYASVSEDEVHFKILNELNKDDELKKFKHIIKENIITKIKNSRSLFSSIPDSYTIQKVILLLSSLLFFKKDQIKYFLCIIGDFILKKNNDFAYFINKNTRDFLQLLQDFVVNFIDDEITFLQHFHIKYHPSYSYSKSRLLNVLYEEKNGIKNSVSSKNKEDLKKMCLNIVCVATHYSERFEGSENFINNKSDDMLKTYTLYLKNNDEADIVNSFIRSYLKTENSDGFKISWKDMMFVWKEYLMNKNIPSIMTLKTLKRILCDKLTFDDDENKFVNVISDYLTHVKNFLRFWKKEIEIITYVSPVGGCETKRQRSDSFFEEDEQQHTMKMNYGTDLLNLIEEYKDNQEDYYYYLYNFNVFEINEIFNLYKMWHKKNIQTYFYTTEEDVLRLILYYFKDTSIKLLNNKYVYNIKCSMWDKKKDIDYILFIFKKDKNIDKKTIKTEDLTFLNKHSIISIEDIYNFYNEYNKKLDRMIVSKEYFLNYIKYKLVNFITHETFISSKWIYFTDEIEKIQMIEINF